MELTHIDKQGRARMVDISRKERFDRRAIAEGTLFVSAQVHNLVQQSGLPKGNPFEVARMAGIQAAKQTSQLIPLCHPLALDWVEVKIELLEKAFRIRSEVLCRWSTGVEMEALVAVSVAALTLYDMCKAVDSQMSIGEIRLVEKSKSGAPAARD